MVMAEIGGHKAYHIPNHRKVVHHSINSEFVQNKPEIFQTTCRSNLNISKCEIVSKSNLQKYTY